jgi:hypothetical protein
MLFFVVVPVIYAVQPWMVLLMVIVAVVVLGWYLLVNLVQSIRMLSLLLLLLGGSNSYVETKMMHQRRYCNNTVIKLLLLLLPAEVPFVDDDGRWCNFYEHVDRPSGKKKHILYHLNWNLPMIYHHWQRLEYQNCHPQ